MAPKTIAQALHAFQAEGIALQKNAINPHFGSRFIALDTLMEKVLPALNKHGLALVQAPSHIDGTPALATTLIHVESGEQIQTVMPLMLAKNDPQGQGSAITYARRYALMAILGLVADTDDDANSASSAPARRTTQSSRPVATPSEF